MARGLTVPQTPEDCQKLLVLAHDWLEAQRYKGVRTVSSQLDSWPRTGVDVDGHYLNDDEIPARIIAAECQLAIDSQSVDLMPTGNTKDVIKERVEGVVDIEYAEGGSAAGNPLKALALIRPLLLAAAGFAVCRA